MENVTANQAGNYKTALVNPFTASIYKVLNSLFLTWPSYAELRSSNTFG